MTNLPLITKYRPISFEEVEGNKEVVKALSEAVRSPSRPHTYLFTGSSGIGKTTLARIIATEINASIDEIDAATNSGVDDTRKLVEASIFKPILVEPNRLYIIDECHALSTHAWKPLLKLSEDPPPWLYICFATTEIQKVPDTIKTRSYHVPLKVLKPLDIESLITQVSDIEGWKIDNNVFQGIVQASGGSARQALSYLQAGHAAKDKEELSLIISSVDEDTNPAIILAKHLLKGNRNWKVISQLLIAINGEEESAVMDMSRYFAAALVKSDEQQAKEIYRMLRSFVETDTWDHKIHFYTGIGKILWGELPF